VYRTDTGIDYATVNGATTATTGDAIIFVGRRSDKTLLGVGNLTHVDGIGVDAPDPGDPRRSTITTETQSVTFTVTAVLTEMAFAGANDAYSGYAFYTAAGEGSAPNINDHDYADAGNSRANPAPLSGAGVYPLFSLPVPAEQKDGTYTGPIAAVYTFRGGVANTGPTGHAAGVRIARGPNAQHPGVSERVPRILKDGIHYDAASDIDTHTKVTFTTPHSAGATFNPVIQFTITTTAKSYGFTSFHFEIPVYAITNALSTNGNANHVTWFVRPGFGTNLYNIDDGENAGGCILLGVGVTTLDWIDIFTTGVGL
jgi:hypothetical protein